MIQERKQNLDAAAHEKKPKKKIKLPSHKKEIYLHHSQTEWPTNIKTVIQWFYFLNIMEYTADNIHTDITLFSSLLIFSMFQLYFWYHKENVEDFFVETVAITCSKCVKKTGLYMENMNTN